MLIAVMAAVGATLAVLLWRGTDAAALLQTPARPMTTPGLAATASDTIGLSDIRDQALFYATRKYFIEVARPTVAQLPPPSYLLEGTLIIPGKPAVAFLKHQPDGISKTVHPGDALEGWHVGAVESGGVMLAHNMDRIEITAKGATSAPSLQAAQMPDIKAHHSAEHDLILGAREVQNAPPILTSGTDALQKPAIRVYRPPN
ncbi:MAG: hypothetical protein WBW93_09270 [Steroidobacteraceae bacterium]